MPNRRPGLTRVVVGLAKVKINVLDTLGTKPVVNVLSGEMQFMTVLVTGRSFTPKKTNVVSGGTMTGVVLLVTPFRTFIKTTT